MPHLKVKFWGYTSRLSLSLNTFTQVHLKYDVLVLSFKTLLTLRDFRKLPQYEKLFKDDSHL